MFTLWSFNSVPSSSFLGWFLETDQSKTSFRSMHVRYWMSWLASEECLSCSANTTFWRPKTADILNVSQRQRATMKEKRIRDWQEPVSGFCKKSASQAFPCGFGAKNEEWESKTARKLILTNESRSTVLPSQKLLSWRRGANVQVT